MKASKPELTKVEPVHVLTITSIGDPNDSEKYLKSLYGTAYGTKFKIYKPQGKNVTFGKLMAKWPDAHLKPKNQWTGIWALPVPDFVQSQDLIQKDPTLPVSVETWSYGDVAQILHIGSYDQEESDITSLHEFIKKNGYEIAGSHEEVYLTTPDAKIQKTMIRYRVVKT